MAEFKQGDVVRLKSGGPRMTVKQVDGDDVLCEWFDEEGLHHEQAFLGTNLRIPRGPIIST